VGQGAAQAPSQADQTAATAAASVATAGDESTATAAAVAAASTSTPSGSASFNPMTWLSSPSTGTVADPTATVVESSNHANV
jgi:hypothetical protein